MLNLSHYIYFKEKCVGQMQGETLHVFPGLDSGNTWLCFQGAGFADHLWQKRRALQRARCRSSSPLLASHPAPWGLCRELGQTAPGNLAPCPQQLMDCHKGGGKHRWVKGQLLKLVPLPKPGLFRSCSVRKPHLTILYFAVIPIWWDGKCRITIPAILKL